MKPTTFSLAAFFIVCSYVYISPKKTGVPHNGFKLDLTTAGLGQNIFEMQPMFRVRGSHFIYSFEEAWQWPDRSVEKDTIYIGLLRSTSIDSIISIAESIPDTNIYRSRRFTGGSVQDLVITTPRKKLKITTFNADDTIAAKVIAILNSNLPPTVDRFGVYARRD